MVLSTLWIDDDLYLQGFFLVANIKHRDIADKRCLVDIFWVLNRYTLFLLIVIGIIIYNPIPVGIAFLTNQGEALLTADKLKAASHGEVRKKATGDGNGPPSLQMSKKDGPVVSIAEVLDFP